MPNTTKESNAITVSLEMAKKLKENWRQAKTHFAYMIDWKKVWKKFEWTTIWNDVIYRPEKRGINEWDDWISILNAPTAQEILDELPSWTRVISSHHLEYIANNIEDKRLTVNWSWPNSQEALADFWIYCKENKYID